MRKAEVPRDRRDLGDLAALGRVEVAWRDDDGHDAVRSLDRRLHPAVRRPGRCWASIDFAPFAPAEATAWPALRSIQREVRRPTTLAELYAMAEGREMVAAPVEGFGFARALSR